MAKASSTAVNPFGNTDSEAYDKDREYSSFFKPAKGSNRIRILPHSAEAEQKYGRRVPYIQISTHFGIGGEQRSLVCPLKTGVASKCYVCAQVAKISDKEERRELQAKKRYRFAVWDYKNPDRGIQIWEIGWTVKEQIDNVMDKFGDFTDVQNGFDLYVDRAGEGVQSKYQIQPERSNSPLAEEIIKYAVDKGIPDLEGGIVVPSHEELKGAWDGGFDDDEEVEDTSPAWARAVQEREPQRSPRPSSHREIDEVTDSTPLPWEDDNEEEVEEAEQEEEVEEAPRPFGRTRTSAAATSPLARFNKTRS